MQISKLKNILEAVLLGADRTLTVAQMEALFELDEERPIRDEIRQALHEMAEDYASRGYELKQVASGFRLQVKQEYATWGWPSLGREASALHPCITRDDGFDRLSSTDYAR